MRHAWVVSLLAALGCGSDASSGDGSADESSDAAGDSTSEDSGAETGTPAQCDASGLPERHPPDPVRAERGFAFKRAELGDGLIPRLALDNLWVAWGTAPYLDTNAYWADFRARYGLAEATWDNDGLPAGLHMADASTATVDCLFCHADRIAGQTLLGGGNGAVDFQGFYDDLVIMNERAPDFGFPSFPVPWTIDARTGAAGATDAYGLGIELSGAYGPSGLAPDDRFGFTQPSPWWQLRFKDRTYTDGSGQAIGHRTMAAMTLAFGWSMEQLMAQDADLQDMHHWMRSLDPPAWPFDPPDAGALERGRQAFQEHCASCHGTYCGEEGLYPDVVVPVSDIGVDAERVTPFDAEEVAWINGSWFGELFPVEDTDGVLAPPLLGVWASAPYFHNGSVPTLAGVLDPAQRPTRWRRRGSEASDYDPDAVGLRYDEVDASLGQGTIEARKTYDASAPGLSNAGHTYAAELDESVRADLLAYLKTL